MKTLIFSIAFISVIPITYAYDSLILPIKFYPAQKDQCGPASLAMVLSYLGFKLEPDQISKEIFSQGAKGTWELDMVIFAKKLGLKAEQYRGSIEDIKLKISQGKPLIVMVDEGIWFQRKYHYMVVVGFTREEIIVNSDSFEWQPIKINEFLKKWEKTDFWTLYIDKEDKDGTS